MNIMNIVNGTAQSTAGRFQVLQISLGRASPRDKNPYLSSRMFDDNDVNFFESRANNIEILKAASESKAARVN